MRQAVRRPLQTKPSLTSRITRGICVVCFVLCLIVASLMALSLISYSPDDPAWSKAVQTETISNWLGIRGAYFADIVFVALGNSSWILLIALVLFAHQLFYKSKVFALTFELFLIRFIGMLFVIATLSGFFSVYGITDIHNDLQINNTNGGILGHWIGAKFTLFSFSWIELITGQSFSAISASLIFLGFLLIISLILASGKTPLYWLEVSGKLIITTVCWIFNKVPTSTQSNDHPSQEKSALALVEHLMEHQNSSESKSLLSKFKFFKAKTSKEDHSINPKEPTIQEPLIQQNSDHVIQSETTSIGQLLAQQKLQTKTDHKLDPEPFKILQPDPFIMPDRETVDAMPNDQVNKIPTVMQMLVRPKINEREQESEDRSQFESISPFSDSPFHEEAVAEPEINEREQITNKVLELSDWVNNAKNMMGSHKDKLEAPVEKSAAPFSFPMTFNEFNNDQEPSFDSFFNEPNKLKPTLQNRDHPLKDNDDDLLQSLDRLLNPPQEEKTANLTHHSEPSKTYFDDEPEEAKPTLDFNLNFDSPTRTRTATVQTAIEPRGMTIDPRSGMPVPQKAVSHFPMAGQLPNLNLLGDPPPYKASYNASELNEMAQLIEEQLKHFGISVTVANIEPGPVITRFELELAPGVKVAQINNLSKDIARAMSVVSVRVVDIIPGKTYVGLEIPNARRETVYFKEGLASNEYIESDHPLTIILGKDIAGETLIANLGKMPHLLVAGTTGSGKSVGVNTMLLSLLFKATPEEVRLILIDPKMLELSVYNDIPHLLTPVVTDMKESANALRWCVAEMERRYLLMSQLKVRNIEGFNKKVNNAIAAGNPLEDPLWRRQDQVSDTITHPILKPLPFIVVVIDEFADMMMLVGKKCEELIARLAQKARASGIHLILATQRPSVDVITGLIKANIPTRIAFQVSSRIDSRTIIDQQGAETLLGHGDMLYLPPGVGIPIRVHGAFVDDHEVNKIVEFLKLTGEPDYIEDILNEPIEPIPGLTPEASGVALPPSDSEDALFDEAVKVVIESQRASISYVQRKLRVGYQRAARLIEEMEAQGIISAPLTNGSREVLAPSRAMDDDAFD